MNFPCPICSFPVTEYYFSGRDTENIRKGLYDYYRCPSCTLVFLFPLPKDSDIKKYYESKYYGGHKSLEFLQKERKNKITGFIKKGKILDYGCGEGIFLELMKSVGWQVLGFDISLAASQRAKENYQLKILTSTQSLMQLPAGNFNLITLWHTLEHVPDPKTLLNSLKKILHLSGFLVIAVPNITSFEAEIGKNNWFHLDPPRHFYHYNLQSLSYLLNKTGYKIIKTDFFSWEYNFASLWQTFLNLLGSHPNYFYHLVKRQRVGNLSKIEIINSLFVTGIFGPLIFFPLLFLSYFLSFIRKSGSFVVFAKKI